MFGIVEPRSNYFEGGDKWKQLGGRHRWFNWRWSCFGVWRCRKVIQLDETVVFRFLWWVESYASGVIVVAKVCGRWIWLDIRIWRIKMSANFVHDEAACMNCSWCSGWERQYAWLCWWPCWLQGRQWMADYLHKLEWGGGNLVACQWIEQHLECVSHNEHSWRVRVFCCQ